MAELWAAFWLSFGVIFVAELGDKSQLMALAFATRYRAWPVIAAITTATTIVHLGSVALGAGFSELLPARWVSLVAALAFFGFAAWTLRGDALSEGERRRAQQNARSAFLTVGVAFFLAELGDKTMLATITLATRHGWVGVWVGSTLGMVAADALAIVIGRLLGTRLPERAVRYGAAALFAIFGGWLLVDALTR
jgi:putative Ca2+/H+ antiporter (TMEM165/GDT1 family)